MLPRKTGSISPMNWCRSSRGRTVERRTKIVSALKRSFERAEVQQELTKIGGDPAFMGPDEFAAYIKSELPKWRDVVKASGVHLD